MNGQLECACIAKVVSDKVELRTSANGTDWSSLEDDQTSPPAQVNRRSVTDSRHWQRPLDDAIPF